MFALVAYAIILVYEQFDLPHAHTAPLKFPLRAMQNLDISMDNNVES